MKVKDIAKQYGLNAYEFESYLRKIHAGKDGLTSYSLETDIEGHVQRFKKYKAYMAEEERKKQAAAAEEKRRAQEAATEEKRRAQEAAAEEKRRTQEAAEEAARAQQEAELEKQRALANMLISSGFSFEGYRITKYSGYISGDDCVTMPRDDFWGSNKVADNLCDALVKIRRQAIKELKEAAYDLGCNAVVGVDFDYLTMDPQHSAALNREITVYEPYVICVTANGNAVVIEKEDE